MITHNINMYGAGQVEFVKLRFVPDIDDLNIISFLENGLTIFPAQFVNHNDV